MPTTPLDADAEMRVKYHAAGYDHVINLRCNLTEPYTIGTDPTVSAYTGTSDDVTSTALMAKIVLYAKPMFVSTDHFIGWEIWDMQTDPPTFIFGGTDSTVGTHSGGTAQRAESECTLTFKDNTGKRFKQIWFGTFFGSLDRSSVVSGKGMENWVTSMLDHAAGELGNFLCGRSAHRSLSFMSYSIQSNNALERRIIYG